VTDPLVDAGDDAATPLSAEEREGLIPTHIALRRELNELEQVGIADASRWAYSRRRDVPNVGFLRRLHRRMFGDVWRWAGDYSREERRRTGLDHWAIEPALHQLVGDVRYWMEHGTYPPDEIAVRLHHRLTQIHPFPNGNGRFSRLAADLLVLQLGRQPFTWGSGGNLVTVGELRRAYIDALHAADNDHELGPLLAFARS
jgi:Fic-DOC domain mobile mystery protein B